MRLIDADEILEKVEDYGEGQSVMMLIAPGYVRKAPTVKAIPLDKVKQAREEIANLEIQIQSYHNDDPMISQSDVLEILDRLISEVEEC